VVGGNRSGAARSDAARAGGFGLGELVAFYMQQTNAVNQLWTMYAATTFAAGLFAFNVGNGKQSAWLLLAGAAGFLVFTLGHLLMVSHSVTRLALAAEDIASFRDPKDRDSHPRTLGYLAQPVSLPLSIDAHVLIDLCVLAAFAVQLHRLGGLSGWW
jgi:fatty acid desaturase